MCLNEAYIEVHIGKHLCDANRWSEKGRSCIVIAFIFSLKYAITKAQNLAVLKLNGTHQLMVCTDDVNLLGRNENTNRKSKYRKMLDASKKVDVQGNSNIQVSSPERRINL